MQATSKYHFLFSFHSPKPNQQVEYFKSTQEEISETLCSVLIPLFHKERPFLPPQKGEKILGFEFPPQQNIFYRFCNRAKSWVFQKPPNPQIPLLKKDMLALGIGEFLGSWEGDFPFKEPQKHASRLYAFLNTWDFAYKLIYDEECLRGKGRNSSSAMVECKLNEKKCKAYEIDPKDYPSKFIHSPGVFMPSTNFYAVSQPADAVNEKLKKLLQVEQASITIDPGHFNELVSEFWISHWVNHLVFNQNVKRDKLNDCPSIILLEFDNLKDMTFDIFYACRFHEIPDRLDIFLDHYHHAKRVKISKEDSLSWIIEKVLNQYEFQNLKIPGIQRNLEASSVDGHSERKKKIEYLDWVFSAVSCDLSDSKRPLGELEMEFSKSVMEFVALNPFSSFKGSNTKTKKDEYEKYLDVYDFRCKIRQHLEKEIQIDKHTFYCAPESDAKKVLSEEKIHNLRQMICSTKRINEAIVRHQSADGTKVYLLEEDRLGELKEVDDESQNSLEQSKDSLSSSEESSSSLSNSNSKDIKNKKLPRKTWNDSKQQSSKLLSPGKSNDKANKKNNPRNIQSNDGNAKNFTTQSAIRKGSSKCDIFGKKELLIGFILFFAVLAAGIVLLRKITKKSNSSDSASILDPIATSNQNPPSTSLSDSS